jgi:hypothetical protein
MKRKTAPLTLRIDPGRIKWGGPDEVVADSCSICGAALGEDAVPLRMWRADGSAAVFCDPCVDKYVGPPRDF